MGALGFLAGTVAAILWNALFIEPKSSEEAEPVEAELPAEDLSVEPAEEAAEPEADDADEERLKAA
jgi:hypothetical protein